MNMKEIMETDNRHIWHPCSQMKDYESYPAIHIERGEGVWLYKQDGSRILDAIASWWVNLFGHGNIKVKTRIKEQLDKLEHVIFANYTHTPAVELASHLAKLFDGKLPRLFFADNGSASVEVALKMSYHYWYNSGLPEKKRFAYLSGAYHGETIGALSVCSLDLYKKIYQPLLMPHCIEVAGPDCYRCPYQQERSTCQAECFSAMQSLLEAEHDTLAAVIVEPVIQCAAGMRIYSPLYLSKLRDLCTHFRVHLICDEIASGFGRTGELMASYHAGIIPDFAVLSKTITNGFLPLAVVLTGEEIYRAFYAPYEEHRAFMHSHSYTGNPLACAAACAVFELFDEPGIFAQIKAIGRLTREKLMPLMEHKQVGEIRTIGSITAVELVKNKNTRDPFDWKARTGYRIYRTAEENGVLLRNIGDVIYFNPPYIINEEEIAFMTGTALSAIKSVLGSNS